ncbi:DMT family transporter [Enterococcus rivorum]|uniref:Multidrug transporter n=1 Tax=Enterococcus rivorum TaxID=762845 RepID=A0A1E5KZP2_9ENTE|nr:DMT family transporter [Enterococcus rivorum]MBP2099325.1 drug/metabolite transporter (DMT)-like permease [Enterococcus rivorum]OEH83293.1 multidrug transporter [Enterococcus rivorum]
MHYFKETKGHLAAIITIFIWGTTFISTKVLLKDFDPIEILFIRFLLGFLFLYLIYPKSMGKTTAKQNLTFAFAGLSGVTLYFYLENIALTYSSASNIGVIVTLSPFFTAILMWIFAKEKLSQRFFLGFLLSLLGVCLISFNGQQQFQFNPLGDFLGILAAFLWSCYSVLTRKVSSFPFHVIQSTRRIFFYGLAFMIPILLFSGFNVTSAKLLLPINFFNLLFLGLGASAICFVTWGLAIRDLGTVKTSMYIYLVPVITVLTSVLILKESLTILSFIGIVLSLFGLVLSDTSFSRKTLASKSRSSEISSTNADLE